MQRIPKAVDDFAATARKTSGALDHIEDDDGLLGALASDTEVAVDIKTFVRNLKDYGVLRYKNPAPDGGKKSEKRKSFERKFGLRQHRY